MKYLFPLLFILLNVLASFANQKDSLIRVVETYIDQHDPSLPIVSPIIDENISDVSICIGPNNTYFLTGTTGDKQGVQVGIKIWASYDLIDWNPIGTNGYVWTFEGDGAEWQKEVAIENGWRKRGIIAPEIHYIKNTFWLTYTNSNSNQSGILKSLSGKAQGPYINTTGDKPLVKGNDASIFTAKDSTCYLIWNGGLIQKLNTDLSGFTTQEPQQLVLEDGTRLGDCCVQLTQIDDTYVLTGAKWINTWSYKQMQNKQSTDARFDAVLATSQNLTGPYKQQKEFYPHAGGGNLFQDIEGNIWHTISGYDPGSPIAGNPALLPIDSTNDNHFVLKEQYSYNAANNSPVVYVSIEGNNSTGTSWENAYTSLQNAIDNVPDGSQLWIAKGKYDAPIQINLRNGLYFYGGFNGDETEFSERNTELNRTIVTGRNYAKHVISISSSSYIRLDGITIQGGNASGGSFHHHYGAGLHLLGGGETIRIVDCHFDNNKADQDGGALYASVGAAPTILNCSFKNNVARNNGGAAAIYCNHNNGYHTKFYNCVFDNNFAYGEGGTIYFDTNKKEFGLLTLINDLIINNTTLDESGALSLDRNSNLFLLNSTLSYNKGTTQGAVIGNFGKVPAKSRIINSIFYQNYGGKLFSIEGEAETDTINDKITYPNIWVQFNSCLFGDNDVNALVQRNFDRKKWRIVSELNESIMGKNTLNGNPAFADPINGNYHPNGGSEAKGVGTSTYFFKYNLEGERRNVENINVGCY